MKGTATVSVDADILDDWDAHAGLVRDMARVVAEGLGGVLLDDAPEFDFHESGAYVRFQMERVAA